MSDEPRRDRAPYATPNKVLELERRLAHAEGRLDQRCDDLDAKLAELRALQVDLLRGTVGAQLALLRGLPEFASTPLAQQKGATGL